MRRWMILCGFATLGALACGSGMPTGDGGADVAAVQATCASVCACLASACPAYPFAPDCMTACMDTTMNWDLSCRAARCSAARTDPATQCPMASGQNTCR